MATHKLEGDYPLVNAIMVPNLKLTAEKKEKTVKQIIRDLSAAQFVGNLNEYEEFCRSWLNPTLHSQEESFFFGQDDIEARSPEARLISHYRYFYFISAFKKKFPSFSLQNPSDFVKNMYAFSTEMNEYLCSLQDAFQKATNLLLRSHLDAQRKPHGVCIYENALLGGYVISTIMNPNALSTTERKYLILSNLPGLLQSDVNSITAPPDPRVKICSNEYEELENFFLSLNCPNTEAALRKVIVFDPIKAGINRFLGLFGINRSAISINVNELQLLDASIRAQLDSVNRKERLEELKNQTNVQSMVGMHEDTPQWKIKLEPECVFIPLLNGTFVLSMLNLGVFVGCSLAFMGIITIGSGGFTGFALAGAIGGLSAFIIALVVAEGFKNCVNTWNKLAQSSEQPDADLQIENGIKM